MSKTYLIKSFLLLFALAPLSGCMMGPTEKASFYNLNEKFSPYGFTLNPGETIKFQVLHPRRGWHTIATTTTGSSSANAFSADWHYWNIKNIQIPSWGWTRESKGRHTAEVRAVGSNGRPLFTFNDNISNHWNPNGSLYNFWVNAGSGKQSSTIVCHILY